MRKCSSGCIAKSSSATAKQRIKSTPMAIILEYIVLTALLEYLDFLQNLIRIVGALAQKRPGGMLNTSTLMLQCAHEDLYQRRNNNMLRKSLAGYL